MMPFRDHARDLALAGLVVSLLLLAGGCSSTRRVTDPDRTATEQFLLSTAASRAVEKLSVEGLRGRKVFVDTQYFAGSEQPFVIGELRAKLYLGGVQVVPERDQSDIVMEVRSGGVGIDRTGVLVGIPSLLIRAGNDDDDGEATVPLATPELALLKNVDQKGIASVAYIAYWRDSGEVIASSGPHLGWSSREDYWFLGLGERTVGDIPPTDEPE